MNYVNGIAGLKTIAAISVVFYHLNQLRPNEALSQNSWDWYQFIETWTIAVSFFFMVSGMFLGMQYVRARESGSKNLFKESLLRDIFTRLWRLYPAFLGILIVSIGVDIWTFGWNAAEAKRIFTGLFLLGPFIDNAFFPSLSNGALWYIAFDIWCFSIASCILWIALVVTRNSISYIKKYPFKNLHFKILEKIIFWGVILGFIGILISLHTYFLAAIVKPADGILSEWLGVYSVWIFTVHYLVGAFVGECILLLNKSQKRVQWVSDILFILTGYFLYQFLWGIRELGDFEMSFPISPFHFPYTTAYIAGLLLFVPFLKFLKIVFENPVTRYISRMSYSIYLVHGLWIALLLIYLPHTERNINTWYILAGSVIILTGISAIFTSKYLERTDWKKVLRLLFSKKDSSE